MKKRNIRFLMACLNIFLLLFNLLTFISLKPESVYAEKNKKSTKTPSKTKKKVITEKPNINPQQLIPCKNGDGWWGFCNKNKKVVIQFQYSNAGRFNDGIALVSKIGDYGGNVSVYINADGNEAPWQKDGAYYSDRLGFCVARPFSEGIALIAARENCERQYSWKYLDKKGQPLKVVTLGLYKKVLKAMDFQDGIAWVQEEGEGWGAIDKKGQYVIQPSYNYVKEFSEGIGLVKNGEQWCYVDKSGSKIYPVCYDNADPFSDGLAAVYNNEIKLWGYINKQGEQIIEFQYFEARPFHEGLAPVVASYKKVKDGPSFTNIPQWTYIDKQGKQAIPTQYDDAAPFSEGYAAVAVILTVEWYIANDKKWGFINKEGKEVIPFKYDDDMNREPDMFHYFNYGDLEYPKQLRLRFQKGFALARSETGDVYIDTNGTEYSF